MPDPLSILALAVGGFIAIAFFKSSTTVHPHVSPHIPAATVEVTQHFTRPPTEDRITPEERIGAHQLAKRFGHGRMYFTRDVMKELASL